MKIAHIILENFKSYRDKQQFDFGIGDKYITVLEGQMGHGKSNLLNAFYWCLFNQYWDSDKSILIADPDPHDVDLFNKGELKDRSQEGNKITVYVEIVFWDDECNKYTVKRSQSGHFMRNKWKYDRESVLLLERVDAESGEFKELKDLEARVEAERFFPRSLSNYFLFRGENRAELVKLQGKEEFQKALAELSKIEIFRRTVNHLKKVIDEFQRESANLANSEIQQKIKDSLQSKEDAENVLADFEKELSKLNIILQDKIETYNTCAEEIKNNSEALKLQKEKESLEKDESILQNKLKELIENRNRELSKFWGTLILEDIIEKINTRYQVAVESGNYPPNIHPSVIDKILHDLRCICGRDIESKSTEYKILEQLKSSDSMDQVIRQVESLMGDVNRLQTNLQKYPQDIKDFDKRGNGFKEEIKKKRKLIEDYSKRIGNINIDLDELLKKQHEAKDDEIKTSKKIDEINSLIKGKEKEIKDLENELEDYEKQLDKSKLPAIKLSLARKALKEAELLKQKFENSIYDDLEKYTQDHWGILVYNKLNYKYIVLDRKNVYFDVLDEDGYSRRSSMNTGHSILLVLSFISALTRIAKETWEEEFPLILDAPLSEIGDTAMSAALNGFGKVFNQAIIILKDGSISDYVTNDLKGKISKFYWLEYDKQRQHTKISVKTI